MFSNFFFCQKFINFLIEKSLGHTGYQLTCNDIQALASHSTKVDFFGLLWKIFFTFSIPWLLNLTTYHKFFYYLLLCNLLTCRYRFDCGKKTPYLNIYMILLYFFVVLCTKRVSRIFINSNIFFC